MDDINSALKNFSCYLYARCGLGKVTVSNHVSTIRRLSAVIGVRPNKEDAEEYMAQMMQSGASYAHVTNTATSLEKYMLFLGNPMRLGRPKKPNRLIRGVLSEAEVTLLIAAARTLREKALLSLLAYAGLRAQAHCEHRGESQ